MQNLPKTNTQITVVTDVNNLIDEWLDYCRDADGALPKTLVAYRKGMRVFVDWLRETGNNSKVTPATVVRYKGWLQEWYSVQTVNLRLSAVRSFYRWCVITEGLFTSPAESVKGAKRSGSKQHKRDALSDSEVQAVLGTCNGPKNCGTRPSFP